MLHAAIGAEARPRDVSSHRWADLIGLQSEIEAPAVAEGHNAETVSQALVCLDSANGVVTFGHVGCCCMARMRSANNFKKVK